MRISSASLTMIASLLVTTACSVQAGKIPKGSANQSPEIVEQTRGEVKSTLSELHNSVEMMGRVQRVLQRGLAEKDIRAGASQVSGNLLAPSEADTLSFDPERPERFEYRLNNSTSFNLKTRSGGNIQVIVAGTMDDTGGKLAIKDVKLEVIHQKPADSQVFHILYEKHSSDNGTESTEWSIDFRQLNDLYKEMGGEDEAVASLNGVLEVRISKSETHVTAKDFTLTHDDILLVFDEVEIHLIKQAERSEVKVKGHVNKGDKLLGDFLLERAVDSSSNDFKLDLNIP